MPMLSKNIAAQSTFKSPNALPRDEAKKKTVNLTLSFESKSEGNNETNSQSQSKEIDTDFNLSGEILNSKGIKEKYLEFWNNSLTPELEEEFRSLSQEVNKNGRKTKSKSKNENKNDKTLPEFQSQLEESDNTDFSLSGEVLNSNGVKEKYLEFWNNSLTPEFLKEFEELSQEVNETKRKAKNAPAKKMDLYTKMRLIQESRNVGLYVFCDSCDKQRYLPDTKDPLDLPEKWFCWMNPDKEHNTCEAEEVAIDEEEEDYMIYNSYNAGSIVWAKIEGHPWLPAMVEDDPDVEDYFWLEDSLEPTYYHVTFFGEVTRAWIKRENLKPFARNIDDRRLQVRKSHKLYRKIKAAIEEAKWAVQMPLLDRLRKYSFIEKRKKSLRKQTRGENGKRGKRDGNSGDDEDREVGVKRAKN